MAKRIAGVAYWKVNGRQLALRGNFTISPSAFERAGIAGQDYVHGFSEVPRVPFISGDVSLVEGTSVEDIDAMVDETVTAELANGDVWVLRNAWRAQFSEINTREGQFSVRFEGESCTQL